MNSLIEIAKSIRYPEVNKAKRFLEERTLVGERTLLGKKAKDLWNLIAPGRHPTPELPTAIFGFYYDPTERIPEMSFERRLFDSVLKSYWKTKEDIFEAELRVNPDYFNHGKVDKDASSFVLCINVLSAQKPSDDNYITVFSFAEFPKNKLLGIFNKKPQIDIRGESVFRTGDLSAFMLGKPENPQTPRFIAQEDTTQEEAMLPYNIAWRKKFATDILNKFISFAKEDSLEERKSADEEWQREWQERSTRQII